MRTERCKLIGRLGRLEDSSALEIELYEILRSSLDELSSHWDTRHPWESEVRERLVRSIYRRHRTRIRYVYNKIAKKHSATKDRAERKKLLKKGP